MKQVKTTYETPVFEEVKMDVVVLQDGTTNIDPDDPIIIDDPE